MDTFEAQDIAKEVFIRAWHSLPQLKEGDLLGSWLFTIAKRLSLDRIRKRDKEKNSVFYEHEAISSETPEDRMILLEEKEAVWSAIESLEDKYRLVMLLYYIGDYTAKQIGDFLGVPKNTIDSRLHRAKKKMKRELLPIMETTLHSNRLGTKFEQKVIKRVIEFSCFNLTVSDVKISTDWYVKHLGCRAVREPQRFGTEAPIHRSKSEYKRCSCMNRKSASRCTTFIMEGWVRFLSCARKISMNFMSSSNRKAFTYSIDLIICPVQNILK